VVYALARILVGRLAAILASALAIVSPLLVWYSREGRMYAVAWLLVMLSFLALVQAARTRRWPWLGLYAIFIAASLYADVSAVMALVPQAVVIGWFLLTNRDEVRRWWLRIGRRMWRAGFCSARGFSCCDTSSLSSITCLPATSQALPPPGVSC